ncbi:MAG: helix-turn-helix transcriptional regulator [Deltaproteobacteria bacterium]|nr:helix-turn-helix transcriptional regulator [Deltaproteobacteria bacterium]
MKHSDLRIARRALGMTQKDLAARVGVVQSTIVRIERGLNRPSLRIALRLADVLGLDPATFVKDEAA